MLIKTSFWAVGFPAPALEPSLYLICSPSVAFPWFIIRYIAWVLISIILRAFPTPALRALGTPLLIAMPERLAASLSLRILLLLPALKHRCRIRLPVAAPQSCTLRMIWIGSPNSPAGILYIKLFQVLFYQLKFTVLDLLLGSLCGASQIIVWVSLSHKVLEGALLFLRLVVVHMAMITWSWLLVMHLGRWHLFTWATIYVTSISFL